MKIFSISFDFLQNYDRKTNISLWIEWLLHSVILSKGGKKADIQQLNKSLSPDACDTNLNDILWERV